MPRSISNRREESRFGVSSTLRATVEFTESDKMHRELALRELSVSGLAFSMPGPLPGIEPGAMLDKSVIRLGELEIHGSMTVLHTTRGFGAQYIVGAQFFPRSEADSNELIGLVSRLEDMRTEDKS